MTIKVLLSISVIISIFAVKYFKKKEIKYSKLFILGLYIFALYLALVFNVTGVGTLGDIIRGSYTDLSINLIPLKDVDNDMFGFIANIIMFLPLGIILPFLFKKFDKFTNTFSVGFVFSLLIEISQLLNFRATDINDLIANTLGAVIGYFIYKLLFKKLSTSIKINDIMDNNFLVKHGGIIFIIILFMSNFIIVSALNELMISYMF